MIDLRSRLNALPPSVRFIRRDWLNANHILMFEADATACLVDSGHCSQSAATLELVDAALSGHRLARLLNTHCHSDHMGGNRVLQQRHGCSVEIPLGEWEAVRAWDETKMLLGYADQEADRFESTTSIAPGSSLRLGGLEWHAIAVPGHDAGALAFHAPQAGLLISGDALWENGFGLVLPWDGAALDATELSLQRLGQLDVALVMPGHGAVFTDYAGALERAYAKLDAFRRDRGRLAWHVAKVILAFRLMARGPLELAELPAYLGRVPLLRELNRDFFNLDAELYAERLVTELTRARAGAIDGGKFRALT